jgi:hypothetical protein
VRAGRKQPLRAFLIRDGQYLGAVGKEFLQLGG